MHIKIIHKVILIFDEHVKIKNYFKIKNCLHYGVHFKMCLLAQSALHAGEKKNFSSTCL